MMSILDAGLGGKVAKYFKRAGCIAHDERVRVFAGLHSVKMQFGAPKVNGEHDSSASGPEEWHVCAIESGCGGTHRAPKMAIDLDGQSARGCFQYREPRRANECEGFLVAREKAGSQIIEME